MLKNIYIIKVNNNNIIKQHRMFLLICKRFFFFITKKEDFCLNTTEIYFTRSLPSCVCVCVYYF